MHLNFSLYGGFFTVYLQAIILAMSNFDIVVEFKTSPVMGTSKDHKISYPFIMNEILHIF